MKAIIALSAALLVGACTSQPAADNSLLDKKFEQTARHYQKYQHNGQTVYCKKDKVITSAVPVVQCLSETELRQQVESFERNRNAVQRPVMPGAGQGGIG